MATVILTDSTLRRPFVLEVFLAPGRSKKISMTLNQEDFAYFDVQLHDFTADVGDYEILVGASCEDIRLRGLVTLA